MGCLRAGVAAAATGAESASQMAGEGEGEGMVRTVGIAGADFGVKTFLALGVVVVDFDFAIVQWCGG